MFEKILLLGKSRGGPGSTPGQRDHLQKLRGAITLQPFDLRSLTIPLWKDLNLFNVPTQYQFKELAKFLIQAQGFTVKVKDESGITTLLCALHCQGQHVQNNIEHSWTNRIKYYYLSCAIQLLSLNTITFPPNTVEIAAVLTNSVVTVLEFYSEAGEFQKFFAFQ